MYVRVYVCETVYIIPCMRACVRVYSVPYPDNFKCFASADFLMDHLDNRARLHAGIHNFCHSSSTQLYN